MPEPRLSDDAVLEECQLAIGYTFRKATFLRAALTHASGANHRLASNERLEFLGDAILGAVVCDLLYRDLPRISGRGADPDQVARRLATDLREALEGHGARGVPLPGQGDGRFGDDAQLGAGRRLREPRRGDLPGWRYDRRPKVHRPSGQPRSSRRPRPMRAWATTRASSSTSPSASSGRLRPTGCSTRKAPTTQSASRSPRRSPAGTIRRPGA